MNFAYSYIYFLAWIIIKIMHPYTCDNFNAYVCYTELECRFYSGLQLPDKLDVLREY